MHASRPNAAIPSPNVVSPRQLLRHAEKLSAIAAVAVRPSKTIRAGANQNAINNRPARTRPVASSTNTLISEACSTRHRPAPAKSSLIWLARSPSKLRPLLSRLAPNSTRNRMPRMMLIAIDAARLSNPSSASWPKLEDWKPRKRLSSGSRPLRDCSAQPSRMPPANTGPSTVPARLPKNGMTANMTQITTSPMSCNNQGPAAVLNIRYESPTQRQPCAQVLA